MAHDEPPTKIYDVLYVRAEARLRRRAEKRVERMAKRLARARDVHASLRRGVLSRRIIQQNLTVRAGIVQAGADGRVREDAFLKASPAYAAAIDMAASPPVDPKILCTDLQGLHWWVPILKDRDGLPGSTWLAKQKFPYRAIAETRELGLGGIMLDLGANTGRMSISRVLLGDVRAAYCAEPEPVNYECLVRNTASNGLRGLVLPDRVALGAATGVARMRTGRYSGGHRLVGTSSAAKGVKEIEVPMVTLDVWVSRLGIDLNLVSFVKVDIQGWEGHMFAGAAAVLRCRHITWQVEYAPDMLRRAGTNPAVVLDVYRQHFSHFTDLNKDARGERGRPIAEVDSAVEYVREEGKTDLLLFNLAEPFA